MTLLINMYECPCHGSLICMSYPFCISPGLQGSQRSVIMSTATKTLLPPAFEGWGEAIASVCLSVYSQGVPLAKTGVTHPGQVRTGGYPGANIGSIPTQDRTPESTCYTAGCMPLVFMQEDFINYIMCCRGMLSFICLRDKLKSCHSCTMCFQM